MIVAVTRIVMLVVWLGLFLGTVLLTALAVRISWIEACHHEDGARQADNAHRSSPCRATLATQIRARLLMT
jgi:hypothetical protein